LKRKRIDTVVVVAAAVVVVVVVVVTFVGFYCAQRRSHIIAAYIGEPTGEGLGIVGGFQQPANDTK